MENKIQNNLTTFTEVRHELNQGDNKFYFSVIDVVSIFVATQNPRNYWKVLKNRLNKEYPELVTSCNQLKMKSPDGKKYLTDVANTETLSKIIKIVAPDKISEFEDYFMSFEDQTRIKKEDAEIEILIDGYETKELLIIHTMLAGTPPGNISIIITPLEIEITGKRDSANLKENFIYNELIWGNFARSITLPCDIDIDKSEANFENGLLTIILPKLDKKRKKNLKIIQK